MDGQDGQEEGGKGVMSVAVCVELNLGTHDTTPSPLPGRFGRRM